MTATETEVGGSARATAGRGEGTYIVLRKLEDQGNITGWAELERVTARNAEAAIREVAAKYTDDDVIYVAIPGKSWKPRPVRRRERVQLVIG